MRLVGGAFDCKVAVSVAVKEMLIEQERAAAEKNRMIGNCDDTDSFRPRAER